MVGSAFAVTRASVQQRTGPLPASLLAPCLALCVVLLGACGVDTNADSEPPQLGVRVSWLRTSGLPDNVVQLRVRAFQGTGQMGMSDHTLSELTNVEGRQRLRLPWLDAGVPTRLRVEGISDNGAVRFVGNLGPFTYEDGETVVHSLVMVPYRTSTAVDAQGMPDRFLHTSTRLDDGRVLVTGGFGAPRRLTGCTLEDAQECYLLEALSDAWLFDPATCSWRQVAQPMAVARGGHTATKLPGDRVLIAGGAATATLSLVAVDGGFVPVFESGDGSEGAHASFEIFEGSPADAVDARDADRGRLLGSATDSASPGTLQSARFLHAASARADAPQQVVLVGGVDASGDWEVFDDQRSGGYGTYPITSGTSLAHGRTAPATVSLASELPSVWIFGGAPAQDNGDLGERWRPAAGDGHGTVANADNTFFPNFTGGDTAARPEYGFFRPTAEALGADSAYAIVVGGVGPLCAPGQRTASYPSMDGMLELSPCPDGEGRPNAFLMDNGSGATRPVNLQAAHAFGASTRLDDGRVVVTGGTFGLSWAGVLDMEVLTLDLSDGEGAEVRGTKTVMTAGRAWHTSTALYGDGVLSVGGVVFDNGLQLVPGAEFHYLP